ncbi:MAG: S8 family serine peptidase, partial [Bacteroidia bacterium]|nr:S8 family serine peptidase [Bacteroidia bacterium]
DCGSNQWPYFGNCEGTSFATPIVAGVAALVLSVNPCLEPQDVKYILKSTTDPVIDADNYPNGVGTGRVNAYNAVLAAQTYGTESPIVQNTAWSSEHYINGSLIIESGSTLTISSTVRFTAGSNITVKKGAGLIVDGGLLKNATGCYNEPWQGIIVEGDANGLQDVQGYVQLTNGAIIENAITGISSPNGGIVKIYNSTILNCRTGVEILNYPNHINFGEITGSTFTTDDSWIDNQLYPNPIAFIKLDNVKYVKIWGNTFQNLRPIVESDYIGRGIGIECNDAKCSVYSNNSEQDNLFYHLRYGIYAVSTHVTNYLMIENAQFDNNFRGIYLCGMNLAKVNKNIFTIPTAGKDNYCVGHICYGHSYGLSLERCSGYQVEENNFTTDNEHFYTVGLIVKNSGIEPNLIYKNNFTDLTFGAIAQYNNRAYDGDVHPGLEFKCNNFSGSLYYDIAIAGDNGIAEFQGNTNESAENTFSHPCGNNFYDLYNESDYLLYFWTNDEPLCYYKLNPPPTTIYLFYNADNKNACASHLIGGHDPELKKSEMAAKTDSINYIKNEIDIVEDGGNTQELELEVSTAMPCEALDMRDELIDKSPYLSDSVMVSSIINESTFPAVMLRDVLIANPQSAKSDTITKSLDARTNQLPGYMREQIDEGKFVLSPLEIMKNRIDANINTRQRLLNEVLNYYLNDTLSASADSVVAILNREKSPESKLFLASLYIDRHDPESTLQLLNDIPNICQMNSSQMIEYIRMKELLTIQAELMQDSLTYYNMDSIQESTIRTLAGDCKYTAGTLARNIVYLIDSVNYEESVLMPNPQNQNKSYYNKSIEGNAKLEVFPNPALKYFIVDYSIPTDIFQSAQLSITDASGKVVIQRVLLEKENQIFFETGSLSSKEYQCSLYCGNKLVASKKFVVVK